MLRCGPPPLGRHAPSPRRAPLIPKLRGSFAEFLGGGSLGRLGALTPAHLWWFAVRAPESLWARLFLEAWAQPSPPSRSSGFPPPSAPAPPGISLWGLGLQGRTPHVRWGCSTYPSPSPRPSPGDRWCRNLDRLSIACAFRLRLRSRLTLRRLTFRRNPWAFGAPGFHRGWRYSFRDSHSPGLHQALPPSFAAQGTLPYRSFTFVKNPAASAADLAPLHFRHGSP